MCLEGGRFFEKCKQTKGLKCTVSVLLPFIIDNFQTEHPVLKHIAIIAYVWAISKPPAKVAESSQRLSVEKKVL